MFFSIFILFAIFSVSKSAVPTANQFKFVNEGEFGPYVVEYDGNYRALSLFSSPFQLCFYNTTPNAYTLALRMATTRSESLFRWVWEANRGNPVGENATFSLGSNGNLVLADGNGRIAWQTNTANKGVVGLKLLSNGNIVLYDSKNKFIWQSFDYPTDTILVGQFLKLGGPNKLVSRKSEKENSNGPYSLVLESKGISLYYKTKNSPKPYLYYTQTQYFGTGNETIESLTFQSNPETEDNFAYELTLRIKLVNSTNGGTLIFARPKYNATLSLIRLGIDGNLRIFTYYDNVDYRAWEETFTLFSRDESSIWENECQLPERCGNFGVCEESQCVACPSRNGLLGWSKACKGEKIVGCGSSDFGYYKIKGVDHFVSKYMDGEGIKESDCGKKCSKECKCLGYFYNQESFKCWIVYDLKTLTRVENSTHVGYIKIPK